MDQFSTEELQFLRWCISQNSHYRTTRIGIQDDIDYTKLLCKLQWEITRRIFL